MLKLKPFFKFSSVTRSDFAKVRVCPRLFCSNVTHEEDPNVVLDGEFECPDCGNGYATEEHRDNHRF